MMTNNPAMRLQNILSDFQEASSTASLSEVCCDTFKIANNDKGQILYSYAGLFVLIKECREKILLLNISEPEIFLETISYIEEVFSTISLKTPMLSLDKILNKSTITSLKFISQFIERDCNNYNVDEDKLDGLRQEVEDLIKEILSMDLPKEIKDIFIYNLEKIRSAIINYRIWGYDKIKDCIDVGIGQIVRNKDNFEINETNQNVQESSKKFIALLGRVDSLITLGSSIKKIVGPIIGVFIK
ncbi:hypothetical protein [Clostridium estertheticum]|uniref:hypothetical protein n=1 Tax=Clostridium estertheticum TaxID=238834 RepID=UPI001C7D63C3|nr:hypothetical protein [Clostridium estertheticum]MBX4271449.1 hypothetical protein [Clostridium estertheticum]WLC81002.1 hypothetical protein KTC98_07200 [Clostridium estertheticum]